MNIINEIRNFLVGKNPKAKGAITRDIVSEPKEERMRTGNSNGIFSQHEINQANRFQNKQTKRQRANKIAKASRKYNYKAA